MEAVAEMKLCKSTDDGGVVRARNNKPVKGFTGDLQVDGLERAEEGDTAWPRSEFTASALMANVY
jgi:hypothetical protein